MVYWWEPAVLMEKKMTKKLEKLSPTRRIFITSLASVDACEEIIPEEISTDTLKEIIDIASHLTAKWDRVQTLAEKRLKVIEEVERMVC